MLLSLAYDGAPFAGFAPQPNGPTIYGELLRALQQLDPEIQTMRGASRTDAGVHARDQRVAFDPSRNLPLVAWEKGLIRHLPPEIAVQRAWHVPRTYNPRFSRSFKVYRYELLAAAAPDPLLASRAWRVPELCNPAALDLLRGEMLNAVGHHDFAAFRRARDPHTDTRRTIAGITLGNSLDDPRRWWIDVRGDRFMYNMVRILVGTFVGVARGHLEVGATQRSLTSGDRREAGVTAPAGGLCLRTYELEPPLPTDPLPYPPKPAEPTG